MRPLTELQQKIENGNINIAIIKYFEMFVPTETLHNVKYCVKLPEEEGVERVVTEWTKENVIAQLKVMTAEGFELAFSYRGLSSAWLGIALKTYLTLLEDGWEKKSAKRNNIDGGVYNLPLLKAIALKYGFENRIGDNDGDEDHYFINRAALQDPIEAKERKTRRSKKTEEQDDEE
jgi:hypothetical protein